MKAIGVAVKSLLILLILSGQVFSQCFLPENETYKQNTIEKDSGRFRSNLTGDFRKISDSRYFLQRLGKGRYNNFADAVWTIKSEAELRQNSLYPLYTIFTIKDKNKKELTTCKKEYDYKNEVILITQKDANDKTKKEIRLPLEAQVTDYANLVYFLRFFIGELLEGETIRFNFLSYEPRLYKLKASFVEEETLLIGSEKIETLKIAIRPDMGAFNLVLNRFAPPTLLWYDKKEPYAWVRYEGLESGRGSAHIITTVEEATQLKLPVKNE